MKDKIDIDNRQILTILGVLILIGVIFLLGVPFIKGEVDSLNKDLEKIKTETSDYSMFNSSLTSKKVLLADINKQIQDKEAELKPEEKEGLLSKSYLESSNKNIFFLFSHIAEVMDTNISELDISTVQIKVINDEIALDSEVTDTESDTEEETVSEETDVVTEEDSDTTGDDEIQINRVETINQEQVSVSMYGDYTDIEIYFELLSGMSDNFELHTMDISTVVLEDGIPIGSYNLKPNTYSFIQGSTMTTLSQLDIFYYEYMLKENARIIEEREKQERLDALNASLEQQEKKEEGPEYAPLISKYSINEAETLNVVRYYSDKYNVPVDLMMGIIDVSSGFNTDYITKQPNGTTNRGLMQLNSLTTPKIVEELGYTYTNGVEHIPYLNIEIGAMLLRNLSNQYKISFAASTEDMHFLLGAFSMGLGSLEEYSKTNTDYTDTPYETQFSKGVLNKRNDYVMYDDTTEVEPYSYSSELFEYARAYSDLTSPTVDRSVITSVELEEEEVPLKEYSEVTIVRATFLIKGRGPNTLLKEDKVFNFSAINTKANPFSGKALTTEELKELGNNGEGEPLGLNLWDKEIRESEIARAKEVIRNRVVSKEDIEKQINYLKLLSIYNMIGE